MSVLRARLYDLEQQKQREADSAARRSMIGAGDRSDKIRTYNFPQDRVTDHRIGMDLSNLPEVMDGDLDKLIDALITTDQAERLTALLDDDRDDGPAAGPSRRTWAVATVEELIRTRRRATARVRFRERRGWTPSCSSATRSGSTGRPDRGPSRGAGRRIGRRRATETDLARREAGRAGRLHPRHQGVPRPRLRGRPAGAHPAARDRAAGRARARPRSSAASAGRSAAAGRRAPVRVADVGTGSGAIAVALAVGLRRRRMLDDVDDPGHRPLAGGAPARPRERGRARASADRIAFVDRGPAAAASTASRSTSSLANLPYVRTTRSPGCRSRRPFEPRAGARRRPGRAGDHPDACSTGCRGRSAGTAWRSSRSARTRRDLVVDGDRGAHCRAGPRGRARTWPACRGSLPGSSAAERAVGNGAGRRGSRSGLVALDLDGTLIGDGPRRSGRRTARGDPGRRPARRSRLARDRPDATERPALRRRARASSTRSSPTRAR